MTHNDADVEDASGSLGPGGRSDPKAWGLKEMTGADLLNLRDGILKMSRREFAEVSGISEASLFRYETKELGALPPWVAMTCSAVAYGLPPYQPAMAAEAALTKKLNALPAGARLAVRAAMMQRLASEVLTNEGVYAQAFDATLSVNDTSPDAGKPLDENQD